MQVERSRLVVSALLSSKALEPSLLESLEERFGRIDFLSERLPFHYTRYYEPEMGPDLYRRMISFANLVPPDSLVGIKLEAQRLEDHYRDERGNRRINLDPGLLGLHNFILATHKNYVHRIYLGDGVFADLTLLFKKGSFRPLQWTYPDYASADMIHLLNLLRRVYLWQRRREARGSS